jgi:hypothetical protein
MLFIAVTCLFGAMHVLAGAALVQDTHDTRDTLASFTSADVGFVRQPCGAMTWCFLSLPMDDELGAAGGTMDALASALGLPLARLRCALPEELCAGVTPQLVGRRTGLSSVHIQRNATARLSMLTSAKLTRQQSKRLSVGADNPSGHAPATGTFAHELQPSVAATPLESHRLDRPRLARLSARWSPALGVPTPPTRHELLASQPERQQPRAPEEVEQEPVSPRLHGHLPAEWVAATAMMHAALAIRCLLPPCEVRCAQHLLLVTSRREPVGMLRIGSDFATVLEWQLAELQAASAAFLTENELDPGDTFFPLLEKFKCMLASDNLFLTSHWFERARLWRIILLADDCGEGWWEPSQGLAFALQAVCATPVKDKYADTLLGRLRFAFGASACFETGSLCFTLRLSSAAIAAKVSRLVLRMAGYLATGVSMWDTKNDDGDDDGFGDNADAAEEDDKLDGPESTVLFGEDWTKPDADSAAAEADLVDCPLTHTHMAILRSMPRALLLAVPRDEARRIWATHLTAAVMRGMDVSWAMNAPGYFGQSSVGDGTPETLLDRAEAWLAWQLAPKLTAQIQEAAMRTVASWATVHDQRVAAMRKAELSTSAHRITLFQKLLGDLYSALVCTHESLAIFTSPGLNGIKRYQSVFSLGSSILACLTVNIWHVCTFSLFHCFTVSDFVTFAGCFTARG